MLVCGCLHIARLSRWTGYRTLADRLVLILHVAYAFVPVGFILGALSAFDVVAPSAGIHAWTGGAIGTMTLAVMSRATLGHTGRQLQASVATQLVYAAVIVAALARVCCTHDGLDRPTLPCLPSPDESGAPDQPHNNHA